MRSSIVLTLALCGIAALGGCTGMRNGGDVIRVDRRLGFRNAKQWVEVGVRHVQRGEVELGEEAFKNSIQVDETYGPAHNNLGRVYFQRRDLKRAAEAFDWAMKFMPDRPEPANNLGLAFEAGGKLTEAIELYRTAKTLAPENSEYLANFVRARIRRGDRGADLRSELQTLKFIEKRPEWTDWVDRHLATLAGSDLASDAVQTSTPAPIHASTRPLDLVPREF